MARQPRRFRRFIGKKERIRLLERHIEGALARGEAFPHCLLHGPSGSGKTFLARELANEFGTKLILANGRESEGDLRAKLERAKPGDFVFIDEAQGLDQKSHELLYEHIDGTAGRGAEDPHASNEGTSLAKPSFGFTIVLATDQPGALGNALHKRMAMRLPLDFYTIDEMREIVTDIATDLEILITRQAVTAIAKLSRGIPRRARDILKNCRTFFHDLGSKELTASHIQEYCKSYELTEEGFDELQCKYLRYLAENKRASLESLASYLGIDAPYVKKQIEPDLLRDKLISIEPRGRMLSDTGRKYVEAKLTTVEDK